MANCLGGCTPCAPGVLSWRSAALAIGERMPFLGLTVDTDTVCKDQKTVSRPAQLERKILHT